MGQLGILLFASPVQHRMPATAADLAEAASRGGHVVTVFLLGDAVYCTSRALSEADPDGVAHRFAGLPRSVVLVNCSTCARFRGLRDEGLIDNARNGTLEDLVDLLGSSDRFLALTGDA
ncbi:MAG TPA: DsrE family protein [Thermoplasmata archaeon]|nr:DsrE family protein [Thermoplasmata archaeon]